MFEKTKVKFAQSGAIPYRINDGHVEVMLITNRKKSKWIIPKGMIESNMTAAESAVQEAYEEAGVMGYITQAQIGSYKYKKYGASLRVAVYPMKVTAILDEYPEKFRGRKWLRINEAAKLVKRKELKQLIRDIEAYIEEL